jgi:hypothetical protein
MKDNMLHHSKVILISMTSFALLGTAGSQTWAGDRALLTGHLSQKESMTITAAPEFALIDLEMPEENLPPEFSMTIEINGEQHQIEASRYSMRGPDFNVLVDDGLQLNEIAPSAARTYKGTVAGREGSKVRASLLDTGLHAMIDLGENGGTWFVQPLASFEDADQMARNIQGASKKTHVVLTDRYEVPEGYGCGNDFFAYRLDEIENKSSEDGGLAGANTYLIEIGTDSDYEFFVKNSSNVNSTVNDIELIWNFSESVYEDDVSIVFELTTIVVRASSNDPYSSSTDSSVILNEFRNRWNSTANDEYRIKRDVAQIFTGKNVANGVLGLATVGVVCNQSFAYAMVESRWTSNLTFRTAVTVHELGHNFNAGHCDQISGCSSQPCRIMCSSAGGCDSINGSNFKFETCAVNSIVNYRNSVTCDTLFGDSLELPFADSFESISSLVWVHNKGGFSTTNATAEVDGTRSLNLDSINGGEYSDDEIRSQNFNAAGFSPMYVSFHTQHKGVEAGKSLRVEYVNSSSDWVVLDEIVSDGNTQTAFVFHEYEMPSDAQTVRFRLRFITDGSSSNDDWYIDMLEIDDSPENSTPCPADFNQDEVVDGVDLAFLLGNWGLAPGDLDGDGTTSGSDLSIVLAYWGSCP